MRRILFIALLSTWAIFGLVKPVLASDVVYPFHFADDSGATYDNAVEGSPWYIRWGTDLCNSGNINLYTRGGATPHSGTYYYSSGDQACNSLNQPLINHLFGQPSGTYHLEATASTSADFFYYSFDWSGTEIVNTGATRIISVDPDTTTPLTVIASGTPVVVSAFVWVSDDDFEEGMKVVQRVRLKNTIVNPNIVGPIFAILDEYEFEYPITQAGYSDLGDGLASTTIFYQDGIRTMITTIEKPSFSFFGFGFGTNTFVSRTDEFIVGTTTLGDQYNYSLEGSLADLSTSTSTVQTLEACNPFGDFSVITCITGLIIPSGSDFIALFQVLRTDILTRVPLGYITRVVDILSSTATSTIPDVVIGLPSTSPLAGTSTLFAVNTGITSATNLLANTFQTEDGDNIWDLITPLFRMVMYILLLMLIVHDITGIHKKP